MEDWEHRRDGETTNNYLGRILEDYLGLEDLAERARDGEFNEFHSHNLEDPLVRLVSKLEATARPMRQTVLEYLRILNIVDALRRGEFDMSMDEVKQNRWVYASSTTTAA